MNSSTVYTYSAEAYGKILQLKFLADCEELWRGYEGTPISLLSQSACELAFAKQLEQNKITDEDLHAARGRWLTYPLELRLGMLEVDGGVLEHINFLGVWGINKDYPDGHVDDILEAIQSKKLEVLYLSPECNDKWLELRDESDSLASPTVCVAWLRQAMSLSHGLLKQPFELFCSCLSEGAYRLTGDELSQALTTLNEKSEWAYWMVSTVLRNIRIFDILYGSSKGGVRREKEPPFVFAPSNVKHNVSAQYGWPSNRVGAEGFFVLE